MENLIQAKHLKFSYGKTKVLKDINFTIHSGEIVGLIGENGAGKTTLINILLGLYPTAGKLTLFGKQPGSKFAKAQIGYMRQKDMIIPNITVQELLKEVAIHYSKPLNENKLMSQLQFSQIAHERLTNLSGGQLRQVTFAVALVSHPNLLFLDEPTVGMDVNVRQNFWQQIERLKQQGKTIIITSHYLNEIQDVADRLLLLKSGSLIFQGTFSELQRKHQHVEITFQTDQSSEMFTSLPGVVTSVLEDGLIHLRSTDGDATLYGLTANFTQLHQITVTHESLETIFMQLTKKEVK